MSKKIILTALLLTSALVLLYLLLRSESNVEEIPPIQKEQVRSDSFTEELEKETSQLEDASKEKSDFEIEMEAEDAYLQEIEQKWKERVKTIFIKNLNLSVEDFAEYEVMREGYEEDRFEAYEKFHEEKRLQGVGKYPITVENDVNDPIVEEYRELFKNRFGEDALILYSETLVEFNKRIREEDEQESADNGQRQRALTIDF